MHKKIYFVLILFTVVFSIFFSMISILAAQQEEPVFSMEEIIVIASKYPQELLDSVASVEIITKEEIAVSQSENLAGIISNIAGLEIVDYGSPGDVKAVSIRGSSPEQVLIMIDGQVVNDPQTGKIDLGLIPADIIEKVEIYHGPASALYGANALGGVINILTRSGEVDSKGTAEVHLGSYHTQKYQLSYQNRGDDMSYYLTGQFYKTDGERENSQLDKTSFMTKISQELDKQTDLSLTLRYHDYQRGLPGSLDYPTPDAVQNNRDFNLSINWQKKEEDRDINVIGWYGFHRLYYDNPDEWGHIGPSIHKTYTTGLSIDSTFYDVSFGKNDLNRYHTLTWGAEVMHNRVDSTDIGNYQDLNGAVFIQDVWQPREFEDLNITTGIRYDYNPTFGGQFNPRVGIVYRLQDEVSFHASLGRAYRAPTYDDLYWPEDGYVGGNPDLLPETAWAYEAGLRFISEKGDSQAELNIFRKDVSQLINWAADSNEVWRPSNIGSARVDGVEILLKKECNENFMGNLNYTYLDAKDLETDRQLKPNHKYGFGLTYFGQVGEYEDGFIVGLDGYVVAGRPDDLEHYYLFDANISRDFTLNKENNRKIKLNFSIKNLFDQQPELVIGYPIQSRTFMVGISTDF
jgi:outer membrane cobalamin receptor